MGGNQKRAKHTTPPPPVSSATAISSVLGNDEVLRKILLGLEFPTCLVRASLVSKRWLRHASDQAFLRRFRQQHPPRLLGFYVNTVSGGSQRVRFVPRPQLPPEFAAIIRRRGFDLPDDIKAVTDCRNGDLVVFVRRNFSLCSPLRPERGITALPQIPVPGTSARQLLPEHAGDRTAVSFVRDDRRRSSSSVRIARRCLERRTYLVPNGPASTVEGMFLRLARQWSFFRITLPKGVKFDPDDGRNYALSRAEGSSGFYLIYAKGFEIHVWFHGTGGSGAGNWKLLDTICLWQAFGHLADPTWRSQGAFAHVAAVGDNADFVFLQIQHQVFYMHVNSRAVEKVFESQESEFPFDIHPFMMVCPPKFPALNDNKHA
ncbi:unnamed protein product [Urochloa decumbens]|uniref:F-box domain-containing protein n=1 Tax=Urochloa decumbens TaxID=240449 RepID=A0ABC8ZXN8_9POAL